MTANAATRRLARMSRTDPAQFPAVLIVEDDPTIGHHLHLGLQGHGYPTAWCRTGAAALIHVTEAKPRIVFLDLGLPDLDGVERARYVTTAGRIYCGHRHGVATAESWLILVDPAESQRRVAGVSRSTTLPPIWLGHRGSTADMASVRTALRWCRGGRCSSKLVRSCSGVLFALIEGLEVGPG
jgi:CheY-like chemotaxis protein